MIKQKNELFVLRVQGVVVDSREEEEEEDEEEENFVV